VTAGCVLLHSFAVVVAGAMTAFLVAAVQQ